MAPTTQPRQLFLQALLSQTSLSYEKALSLHQRCLEICYEADPEANEKPGRKADPAKFATFKEEVNIKLEPLGLEIRDSVLQEYRVKEQDEGRVNEVVKWVSLINTVSDTLAQAATSYTPTEIAYLKLIIEAIILAPRFAYSISTLTATRMVADIKKGKASQPFSNKQAEKLLERFCGNDEEGWLVRSDRGRYSLSPRSLTELEDYLKTTYQAPQNPAEDDELDAPPVLLLCELDRCRKLVTLGLLCPNCSSRGIHGSCKSAVLRKQGASCPCGEDWTNETDWLPVGEKAVRDGEDEQRGKKRVVRDDSDEEDEMPLEDEMGESGDDESGAGPSSTRKTRTARRSSTVSAAASTSKGKGRASTASGSGSKKNAPPAKKSRRSSTTKSKGKKKKVAGLGELSDDDEEEEEEDQDDEDADDMDEDE